MNLFNRYLKIDLIRATLDQGVDFLPVDDAEFQESVIHKLKRQDRLEISQELKTEVTVKTKQGEDTDYGSVKIYNPSQRTISFIQPNIGGTIEIVAGYGERNGLVFRGNVGGTNQIYVERSGPDIIMTLQLGSYTNWMQEAFFRKAFAGQYGIETIIRTALDETGIPHGGLHDAFTEFSEDGLRSRSIDKFVHDFTWSGKVKDLVQSVIRDFGLIHKGITATPRNGYYEFSNRYNRKKIYHEVNSDTGLLDTPRWKTVDNTPVFTFKSMMNPDIINGSDVEIASLVTPAINGRYTVTKVDYDLSNYDGSFEMSVEAVPRRTFTEIAG